MKAQRAWIRRGLKWAGVASCACMVLLWLLSVPTVAGRCLVGRLFDTQSVLQLRNGMISLYRDADAESENVSWHVGWESGGDRLSRMTYGLIIPFAYRRQASTLYVVPLWFGLLISGGVTAWLWARDRRLSRPAGTKPWRRDRLSQAVASRVAAVSFFLVLPMMPVMLIGVISLITGAGSVMRDDRVLGLPSPIGPIFFLGITVFGAWLFARTLFNALRWRWIDVPETACNNCGYDLTGNMSGQCSECGASVPAAVDPLLRPADSES